MRRIKIISLTIIISTVLFLGCAKNIIISESSLLEKNPVIVESDNGFSMTMGDLYEILKQSNIAPFGGIVKAEDIALILDSILVDTFATIAAKELDLSKYPDIDRRYRSRLRELLIDSYFNVYVRSQMSADSMEVVDHFYNNPDIYSLEEQIDAYHILINKKGFLNGPDSLKFRTLSNDSLEAFTKAYIYDIYGLLGKNRLFSSIAYDINHDGFRKGQGGRIGFVSPGRYYNPFDSVAFVLAAGEHSKPYQDKDGWHIVYVDEHIYDGLPEFTAEVFDFAKINLLIEKSHVRGAVVKDSLRQFINKVEYNEPLLDKNIYKANQYDWIAVLDDIDTITVFHLREWEDQYRKHYKISNTTPEMKREIVNVLKEPFVIERMARAARIDTLPVVRDKSSLWKREYARSIIKDAQKDYLFEVSEEMKRKYYNDNIDDFVTENTVSIQQIICDDSALCEFVRDQAYSGIDFLKLASEYNPGNSPDEKRKLGDIGPIGPKDIDRALYRKALTTTTGEISKPFKYNDKYYMFKVVERFSSRTYDQAKFEIGKNLEYEHAVKFKRDFQISLLKQFGVKYPNKLNDIHMRPLEYRTE